METVNAIASSAIALAVAIITLRQWLTDRARLRHELFDLRYEIYERMANFLAETLMAGRVAPGAEIDLLRQTKRAYFVFSGDTQVTALISETYREAVELHALCAEEKSLGGQEKAENLERQRTIKNGFEARLHSLEKKFERYLKLAH